MIEPDLLYGQIADSDADSIERPLLSLLHASFEEDRIVKDGLKSDEVSYSEELVDVGRFDIDQYDVRKYEPEAYRIKLSATYTDIAFEETSEGSRTPVNITVTYSLTVIVGNNSLQGSGTISVQKSD